MCSCCLSSVLADPILMRNHLRSFLSLSYVSTEAAMAQLRLPGASEGQ